MKVAVVDVPYGDAAPADMHHPCVERECSFNAACDFELCIRNFVCCYFFWQTRFMQTRMHLPTAPPSLMRTQKIQLSRLGRGSRLGHKQAEGSEYNMVVKRSTNILIYWHPKASGMLTKGNNNNKKGNLPK